MTLEIPVQDVELVSENDMALAIQAAEEVFTQHGVDPMACEVANQSSVLQQMAWMS